MLFPNPLALVVIGTLSAYLAKKRGKNPALWFFLGMLFGIFGLIYLVYSSPLPKHKRAQAPSSKDPNTIDITPKVDASAKEKFWYYLNQENVQKGPMSFDRLIHTFHKGEISAKTLVWNETLERWQPLANFMQSR